MIRRTVVARAAASLILAGTLIAGTAGCTFISTQATLIHYDAGDGVGVSVGDLKVRNMLALISDDGRSVSLLMTVINSDTSGADLNIQYPSDGAKTTASRYINAGAARSFGNTVTDEKFIVLKPGVDAGGILPIYLQYGDHEGVQVMVPVLNADLPQYEDLKPPATKR